MQTHLLAQIHTDIDDRVATIRRDHAPWLCGKGCAACCRNLAGIPLLTPPEWQLLQEGLAALDAERLAWVSRNVAALAKATAGPLTCPLLDADADACLVYPQRPVACRTYGFYVQRHLGLYCGDILAKVDSGAYDLVVWGNQDAVDAGLGKLGQARTLTDWWQALGYAPAHPARWAGGAGEAPAGRPDSPEPHER